MLYMLSGRRNRGLPGRRRQTEEARGVLPHELLDRPLAQRLAPRDHGVGVIGENGLGMRVVRLEHEHVIAEEVDHPRVSSRPSEKSMPQKTRPSWAYSTGVCASVGDTEP